MPLAKCSYCSEPFERLFKFCPNCGMSVLGEGYTDKGVAVRNLFDIARNFASVTDVDVLLKKISEAAEQLTHAEASSVMLLDPNKEHLYFKTVGGEKGALIKTIKVPVGQGIAGWVAQNNQPLLIDDVTKDERFSAAIADAKSGFVTRSILAVPMVANEELIGVMEVLNKKENQTGGKFTPDDQEILQSLAGFAAVSIVNSRLNAEQKNFFANIIEILVAAIEGESRTKNLAGHCWRVAQISCSIARRLKITGQLYKNIYYASLLHDIGYIGIRRQILSKKAVYTMERIELMHPQVGAEMLETITLLKECASLVRHHQELWDGTGYPDKLRGEEIPLGARIISFAEAIEDLREVGMSEEEYKKLTEDYIAENTDRLFDPQVAAAYLLEGASAAGAKV